jgi:WD40 repeat protein
LADVCASVQGHTAEIVSLSFNQAGDRIITGSFDGTARIWVRSLSLLSLSLLCSF